MAVITGVAAREVLDSRGKPTLEVELCASDGSHARAIVPSGASAGKAEARELRDGDRARYDGQGVLSAVENVRKVLAPAVIGCDPVQQGEIDAILCRADGTPQKSRLGGNTILGVSLAAARLAAAVEHVPLYCHFCRLWQEALANTICAGKSPGLGASKPALPAMPMPMTNMISGGLHAGGNLSFQDFLIIPHGAPDYPTALEWIVRVYRRLGALLAQKGYEGYLVGDEGGFGPRLESNERAAEFVVWAIEAAGLQPGGQVSLALDVASSHFFHGDSYRVSANLALRSTQMIELLVALAERFPIVSIEDGLAEDDWEGWQRLHARLGARLKLVGDDLFATNPERIQRGIDLSAANSVLVKMNQVGTITETMQAMAVAVCGGMQRVISARSGETEDDSLADLAVGVGGDYIKIGSVARSERLSKYNRLLRIAEELGRA